MEMDERRVVMGLLFYPRGGSAYVVRYLSPALERAGWSVSLAVGSLGARGAETNAPTFFDGLDVHAVDATDAVARFEAGGDAIAAPQPMHPSYEDRAGVPDVVFASVPPELADHLTRRGTRRSGPAVPTRRACSTSTTSRRSSTPPTGTGPRCPWWCTSTAPR